jgi:hypothetical protein
VYLIVTIDTEEDNWGQFTRPSYTVDNLQRIPRLQDLLARYAVKPTYLISHPVATSEAGIELLGTYRAKGLCEIGAHPHPSNTPPFEEARTDRNSYLCNLPADLQYRKIEAMTRAIESNFGCRPTVFRSGRWGFGDSVAGNLLRLGYSVDTSIFPVWDWKPGPDFRSHSHEPFCYAAGDGVSGAPALLEIPATVDFLQPNRRASTRTFHAIDGLPLGHKALALLRRLRLLNRVCLSPEVAPTRDMIQLATTLAGRGAKVVNLFFHSPTLLEGCTPFTRTPADVTAFLARLEGFLAFAASEGFASVTPSALTAHDVGAGSTRVIGTPEYAS